MAYTGKYSAPATFHRLLHRLLSGPKDKSRILLVGRAVAGKTSILQRVAYTTNSRTIYQGNKEVKLEPSMDRHEYNIEDELVFSNYPGYIFHNSRGFEAGGNEELRIVQEFIQKRTGQTRPQDRLHAIWYCVPMDNHRPELDLKHVKDICSDENVSIIVVFTKYDQFLRNVKIELEDYGNPYDNLSDEAERQFEEHYLRHIDGRRFVRLEKTHRPETRCDILLSITNEVLNEAFVYNASFASSETSIVSYKTEKTVNSHTSHIAPRRKFAEIRRPRLPQGLVTEEVDDTSIQQSEFDEPFDRSLDVLENSIYGVSLVNTASRLERTLNQWASEVLRIAPATAAALQEAVLTAITVEGESIALFTDVRPMTVQYLLQHAISQVVSDGIVNSLIVSNSAEENLALTRVHERLLSRDPAAAAIWRQKTFFVAEEFLPAQAAQMVRTIFEENMPSLAQLLPDSADDPLGTRGVLEEAFTFSCMLRGTNADGDALYRSFVPKMASTLDPVMIELVKPCRLIERGEVDRVGATIFPGLFEVLPTSSMVQTVVRPAQVICECELLETISINPSPPPT